MISSFNQSSNSLFPFVTAGAIVSWLPSDGIPTTKLGFSFAYAITSVLSFAQATPVPFSNAVLADAYVSNFCNLMFG